MDASAPADAWTREKVVQLFSEAQLTSEGSKKAVRGKTQLYRSPNSRIGCCNSLTMAVGMQALLRQITELVLNKQTTLLNDFGPLFLELQARQATRRAIMHASCRVLTKSRPFRCQVDPSNPVRSLLAEIIDKVGVSAASSPS